MVKRLPNKNERWPESKKLEVVQAYMVLGNLTLAASTAGVPLITVKVWKASQWWKDTEHELRRSDNLKLNARLRKVVTNVLEQMEDRVINGDEVLTKQGEIVRKKISGADAAKIASSMIDRSLVLEKTISKEKEDQGSIEARLQQIKQEVLGFIKKPTLASKVIEGEVIDAEPIEEVASETTPEGSGPSEEQDQRTALIEETNDGNVPKDDEEVRDRPEYAEGPSEAGGGEGQAG